MTRHSVDHASFELPEGWSVVTVVTAPKGPSDTFASNLVLTRDTMRSGETLATYVDRQIVELARNLKRFQIRAREDVTVGGVAGHELRCSWHGAQGPIEQTLSFVPLDEPQRVPHEEPQGGVVMTFTATAPKNRAERMLALFKELMTTISFDTRGQTDAAGSKS